MREGSRTPHSAATGRRAQRTARSRELSPLLVAIGVAQVRPVLADLADNKLADGRLRCFTEHLLMLRADRDDSHPKVRQDLRGLSILRCCHLAMDRLCDLDTLVDSRPLGPGKAFVDVVVHQVRVPGEDMAIEGQVLLVSTERCVDDVCHAIVLPIHNALAERTGDFWPCYGR